MSFDLTLEQMRQRYLALEDGISPEIIEKELSAELDSEEMRQRRYEIKSGTYFSPMGAPVSGSELKP
jgi:hypothetical protein